MKDVTLLNVGRGAAPQLFSREWERVLENIQDPNTAPDAVRKVTVVIEVKPTSEREAAAVTVSVNTKLAPTAPVLGQVYMGLRGGKLVAVTNDPHQRSLGFDGEEQDEQVVPMNHRKAEEG